MTQSHAISNEPQYVIHPKKFVLWLLIVASLMLFAGFTSAYIVRRGEGNWEIFSLPFLFMVNSIIIILSSVSMQWSFVAAKKDNKTMVTTMLGITVALGIAFCLGQYFAWKELVANNVFFAFSNPSNSFVYVISGVHLFHVIGGLIFVTVMFFQSMGTKINSGNTLYLNMCATYWHFIGILWLYLYIFLYLYR